MPPLYIDHALASADASDKDRATLFASGRNKRQLLVDAIVVDLVKLGEQEGYTGAQIRTAVQNLFRTFAIDWFLWLQVADPGITTSIQNDATLPWLNIDVAGTTVRQRLINRLS